MNTKLTLQLNKRSIERAKRYAQQNNKSLSAIVESYFNMITFQEKTKEIEISPNVIELSGIIKLPKDFNSRDQYGSYIKEKYSK